jgi:hypothetical protein
MSTLRSCLFIGVSAVLLACLAGCLVRKEKIRVARDGSVDYQVAMEGNTEMEVRDAEGPDPALGWQDVRLFSETDDKGKETWHRTATMHVPPGGSLPNRFVVEPPPYGVFLQFPTEVTVEQRADGQYYHFRRVYQAMPWRVYDWYRFRHLEDDEKVKAILELDKEKWTEEDYRMVAAALMRVKIDQQMFLLREAMRSAAPDLPQDTWLLIRQSLLALAEKYDWSQIKEALALPKEEREKRLELLGDAFEQAIDKAFQQACEEHIPASQLATVQAELQLVSKRFETINVYGGQGFEITVHLPGEIVGHNGDEIENGGVKFKLGGYFFRDRPHELLATSFVPAETQ